MTGRIRRTLILVIGTCGLFGMKVEGNAKINGEIVLRMKEKVVNLWEN
jgi:hypothetical protein